MREALEAAGIRGAGGAVDRSHRIHRPRRRPAQIPDATSFSAPVPPSIARHVALARARRWPAFMPMASFSAGQTWRQEGILGTVFEGSGERRGRSRDSRHQRLRLRHSGKHAVLRRPRSISRRDSVLTAAFDVVIVGAGIAGCACARELAEAGVQVAIIERNAPAGGATAAGMGHIVVMNDSPAQLALTYYARSLWQKLTAELPAAAEYEERGTLWIAADEEEMSQVHAKQASCTRAGHSH